jgi:hypothetical protein
MVEGYFVDRPDFGPVGRYERKADSTAPQAELSALIRGK